MENPLASEFFLKLASFCRLIRFDKRGTGLSDLVNGIPTLEERMDDVRAVMDAVGSERAALFGFSEGGPMSIVFAATYPKRTSALILYGTYAKGAWAPDYPWRSNDEQFAAVLKRNEQNWGTGSSIEYYSPSLADDEAARQFIARLERSSASPAAARTLFQMARDIDVRTVLPTIDVPTLVLHRDKETIGVENGRYIARHIRNATYVELSGVDHTPWTGNASEILAEVELFLTGQSRVVESDIDRVLATVLFTDIVDSTKQLVSKGDRAWKDLLARHHRLVRQELGRYRGREINTMGDGFLASFDGPARAVRCAQAIVTGVKALGLKVRAGVHTGECEVMGDDLGGVAVHIGARISGLASPGEVLVSSTVRDLVSGSGLKFDDRGAHVLKGVPGEWQLLAAV